VSEENSVLDRLMAVIEDRKANPPAKSYTTSLLAGGVDKIGGKLLEEADELVEAAHTADAGQPEREHMIYEAGDVLYHLLVLLAYRDVRLAEVEAELARRFGVSGLDEKASRQ
jgi:phosphoribosyl-ATP pyrophosphohydrolase